MIELLCLIALLRYREELLASFQGYSDEEVEKALEVGAGLDMYLVANDDGPQPKKPALRLVKD